MVLKRSFDRSNQIIETKIIASKKFNVVPDQACLILTTNPNLVLRVFFTLFNLQGTRHSAEAQLWYHVVFLLSSTFFKFFRTFSVLSSARSSTFSYPALSNLAAALASSSIILPLNLLFVKHFFQIFKSFSSTQLTFEFAACALVSARLSYQTCRFLSIGKSSKYLFNIMPNFSHIYLFRTDKHTHSHS